MVPSLLVLTAAIVTGFFIGKFTLKSEAYRVLFLCFLLTRKASLQRLRLKLQNFGHPMQRTDSLEKTLMLGKIEGRRRRGRQRMRWLDDITDSMDMSLSKLRKIWRTGEAGMLQSTWSQRTGRN